jgi:penicillin-binding protein 1A
LSETPQHRSSVARFAVLGLLGFAAALAALVVVLVAPRWFAASVEAQRLVDAHAGYAVAHKGWSFPAHVWSDAAPLDLHPDLVVEHAKLRGYAKVCPPVEPGQYCDEPLDVVPRGGQFAEGEQPPGRTGWTRPLALEPVLLATLLGPDAEIREHLPLALAPKHLVAAIVAAEDDDFYQHGGVNLKSAVRAAWANWRGGAYGQGASTLTMQVVRNLSERKEKTLGRKIGEALLAVQLERRIGKDGVLQMYLDAPYLGQSGNLSVCGFRAAAKHYWGIDATALDLSQAATLAAILPAPGRYAPDRDPGVAKERRDRVLRRMQELGWPETEIAAALAEPVVASAHALPPERTPPYVQATRAWLEEHLDPVVVYGAGLEVYTALDLVAQARTEKIANERVRYLERVLGRPKEPALETALPLLDAQTGALVAIYGGTMATSTDFDRATQAYRQAGSSFKPLVYALAFDTKAADGRPAFTAADAMPNAPRTFEGTGGWRPRNVGGEYTSTASLAYGLAWSQNIATASLLEKAGGPKKLIELAAKLGFDTRQFREEMGLALGQAEVRPIDMARFAGTIARGGRLASGSPVLVAKDPTGTVRLALPQGEQAISPEAALLTRELMRLVILVGTGGASRGAGGFEGYTGDAFGKTGTTDSEKDLWFVGATARYAGAVWLGYDQPERIGATASDLASPLWGWWMHDLHEGYGEPELADDPAVTHRVVCTISGGRPHAGCSLISAPFLPGTEPTKACTLVHERVEEVLDEQGNPVTKKHESLWKKKAREEEEKQAAEAGAAVP